MAHEVHCHCIMCTLGKKINMIRQKSEDSRNGNNAHNNKESQICKHCGHSHKEDGSCDCGCQLSR